MNEIIKITDESGDKEMLWETVGKPAYEKGLLEGRQEAGLFAIIPMSILENKNLSASAKLLYGEIMALSKKSGQCYATNEYMANMLGISKRSIPQIIKELSGIGLILVNIKRSKKGTYRHITVSFFNGGGHRSTTMGGIVKERGGASLNNEVKVEIDKVEIKNGDKSPITSSPDGEESPIPPVKGGIPPILDLFKNINPSFAQFFKNTTERAAVDRLLKLHGEEKVRKRINDVVHFLGAPFCPVIVKPTQLESKWAQFELFLRKQ